MLPITKRILIAISLAVISCGMNSANAEPPSTVKRRYCCAKYSGDLVGAGYLKGKTACLGELAKPLMEADKFSGDLNCEGSELDVKKVGDIFVKGKKFSIFDYQYTTIPEPGLVAHGGERIIIIENDKTYVGQYTEYAPGMHIRGKSVYLNVAKKLGNRIPFESGSPPRKLLLNGEIVELYK